MMKWNEWSWKLTKESNEGKKREESWKWGKTERDMGDKKKMQKRQILRNKGKIQIYSDQRVSVYSPERPAGRPERGCQAESSSYLLPCTEDERTTGGYCGLGPGIYPFSCDLAPPTLPSAGLALHWPQRYLSPFLARDKTQSSPSL